jgi:PEP-CTERM motif
MKMHHLAGLVTLGLLVPSAAFAASACPAFGTATDCTTVIVIGANGSLNVIAGPGGSTYDGSDDQLVGIYNTSGVPISSVTLNGSGAPIFGFDGDGVDTFGAPSNSKDGTGYGGPDSYFSNISPNGSIGTVNFITPIAALSSTYFSLELPFTQGSITGSVGSTPEPSTLLLLGTGAAGLLTSLRRRLFS